MSTDKESDLALQVVESQGLLRPCVRTVCEILFASETCSGARGAFRLSGAEKSGVRVCKSCGFVDRLSPPEFDATHLAVEKDERVRREQSPRPDSRVLLRAL